MDYNEKVKNYFEGKVVRKDLTNLVKGNAVVPIYVLEYLLGQHCASDDPDIINDGIDKVKGIISKNFVHRADAEFIKSQIREAGEFKIIDKISVKLNDKKNIYEADFTNLGIKSVPISDQIIRKNKKLLTGGVWCIISIGFSHEDGIEIRWLIESVKPIQISGVDLEEYKKARKEFNSEEWMDLLLHTIGLKPELFNRRGKFIQLSRLITHAENNYNFIELGPKGTGKSHIFSELSPHGVLVSGGDVTKATLFIHNTKKQLGLVGYWDIVALDEFEQEDKGAKKTDGDLVKIMQNYMANKSFNRGNETYSATASMAFVGNTKRSVPYMLKHSHLFESIPAGYLKGAFLDRIHLYVPGWEVRILKDSDFSSDFGFIVDYLAEILKEMRNSDYSNLIEKYVEFDKSLTKRDKMAINKTFSGLVKIVYPDLKFTEKEALEMIDFAVEGRKRVKDQLYIIDETFRNEPVEFKYKLKAGGTEVYIETLENLNYKVTSKYTGHRGSDTDIPKTIGETISNEELKPGQIILRDNQTGVSYSKLFSKYLNGAKKITIADPYIRLYHQLRNFQEFCLMISKLIPEGDEIDLHLTTWNEEHYRQKLAEDLSDIVTSVHDLGINLTYEFKSNHDRYIETDNGWKIVLGRGLDFFEKPEGNYNIAEIYQEKRRCRNCEITFIKSTVKKK